MTVKEITRYLDSIAPPSYQESYDNSGLLVGNPEAEIASVVVSLDVTEDVVQEAIDKGAGLIVSHHPIIFGGLKRLTGKNYVERTVMMAIKHDIALYAIHTNLDHVEHGVNARLSEVLELTNTRILMPKEGMLRKLVTFVPTANVNSVLDALFAAGAGHIGAYDRCSFRSVGLGTFRGDESSNPHVGKAGKLHEEKESRVEVILPVDRFSPVLNALKQAHPYEEVAWDLLKLENSLQTVGSGMVGELKSEMSTADFLEFLKKKVGGGVRYTQPLKEKIKRIAVCGGSGSFALGSAIAAGADVFVTADFKYHQFFDADGRIVIADIGHFESEQFTIELLYDAIREKFPNFATFKTAVNTNPILYL